MEKRRIPKWFLFILLAPVLLITFMLGLWAYSSAAAPTFHPNPQEIPSATLLAPVPTWAGAVERARQIVRASVSEQNLPGLSVAVGVGGDIVWAEGFGWADLGTRELDFTGQLAIDKAMQATDKRAGVTPDTRFRIAGVSMALTSAAVGVLLEKGRLKLDEEIQTYVPEFPKKQWPVTLRHLMAHVAGIQNDGGDEAPILERCERTVDGLRLDGFADRAPLTEPGTRYHYSTYGWIVVSAAVEAAAGEPFFTFLRSQVFEPLGLHDTTPENWTEPMANRATSYFPRFSADPRYGPDLAREGDHSCWSGAAAYLSTPADLVRFGLAMNSGKLLQAATVTTLQTPQRVTSGEETGSGLGWRIETVPLAGASARMASQHDARSIGTSTTLIAFPERSLVVAVSTNITFAETKALAVKIAEAFAEQAKNPARQ